MSPDADGDAVVAWDELSFEVQAAVTAGLARQGRDDDPADYWASMAPAHKRDWLWGQDHPHDDLGASEAEQARVAARADPATADALGPLPSPVDDLDVVTMSSVTPERIRWLARGRIPRGKLSVVEGDPKVGKSTLMLDLMARVSTGSPMPDGSPLDGAGHCVLLTAEDGLADTVRPRLDAAGADMERIHVWRAVIATDDEGRSEMRPPSLPIDVGRLEALVLERSAELVVIDVLAAYLGSDIDAHKDQDIRRALMPLAMMAERTGAAVVVLRHLNKSGGANALYRGGGSIGIAGAARSILLAAFDPKDQSRTRRVLAVTACNVAAPVPALAYRLVPDDLHDCARIEWDGESSLSADELLADPGREDERSDRDEVAELLKAWTRDGPVEVKEVRRRLVDDGYRVNDKTLQRARKEAGLIAGKPDGFGGKRCYYQSGHVGGLFEGVHTGDRPLTSTDGPDDSPVRTQDSVSGLDSEGLPHDAPRRRRDGRPPPLPDHEQHGQDDAGRRRTAEARRAAGEPLDDEDRAALAEELPPPAPRRHIEL